MKQNLANGFKNTTHISQNKQVSHRSKVTKYLLALLCNFFLVSFCTEDQNRQTATEALLHSVVLRLGALFVLMLTVGDWSDVLHVLVTFLGEAACLLPSQDLLRAVLKVNHLVHSQQFYQYIFIIYFCI